MAAAVLGWLAGCVSMWSGCSHCVRGVCVCVFVPVVATSSASAVVVDVMVVVVSSTSMSGSVELADVCALLCLVWWRADMAEEGGRHELGAGK